MVDSSQRQPARQSGSARDSEALINALAADLRPVSLWSRPRSLALLWLISSMALVLVASLLQAPWRPNSLLQFGSVPRFGAEILLAFAGFIGLGLVAVQSAVPGAQRSWHRWLAVALAWLPWIGLLLLGLGSPALEPSMAGKRESCYLEVMLESLPPLAIGLLLVRRLFVVSGPVTGALIGLAAGMFPALLMQLSCMYLVDHALTHHLAPVLLPTALGALTGAFLLRR